MLSICSYLGIRARRSLMLGGLESLGLDGLDTLGEEGRDVLGEGGREGGLEGVRDGLGVGGLALSGPRLPGPGPS